MLKNDLPIIKLHDYVFDCIRCGKCCKVLIKTEFSDKKFLVAYGTNGKLTRSPLTTTTVFYNERNRITNYLDEYNNQTTNNFIPFGSLFLKDFPIEFVYSYQVRNKGGYCIFYDTAKKSCNIYLVRPVICKTYPLQIKQSIINGTGKNELNIANCTSWVSEIKRKYPYIQNGMAINLDIENSTIGLHFPNQIEYYKLEKYLTLKFNIFLEGWIDFFIDPNDIKPEMVKKHVRFDMSKFWSWLKENKANLDQKRVLNLIKKYKLRIKQLNTQFNITRKSEFLE